MSGWRDEPIGSLVNDIAAERFVYRLDNHDQVGNRPAGERLRHLVDMPT